jgi:uncharacterized protein (TIGR01244 family)
MKPPTDVAPGFAVAAQLTKADIAALAQRGYRTIVNNRPDDEEPGQPTAAEIRAEAERLGLTYIHIPVTTGTITAKDVAAVTRAAQKSPQPVVAHCRSGTRSYLLWAAGQALDGGADPSALVAEAAKRGYDLQSLPDLVARLRRERAGG